MNRLRMLFAIPALLIATAGLAAAADIRDKAGLFSEEAIKTAQTDLDKIERVYAIPVTIETIDSLEGQPIRDVTTRHAEQAKAKGIYVLISKDDSKMYVEASKGYRDALTREKLQTIDDAFVRQFKKKDYDAGLSRGVSQIETTVAEARPVAKTRRAGQVAIPGKPSSGGMGMWLTIGLGLLALFLVIRVLGALFSGGNRGYANNQRMMGPGGGGPMGGPGYGGGGYGGGGGGGGFMSSMFGGIGGALAGNWLYDQFSGRHHDSSLGQSGYDPAAGAPPVDPGPEWGAGGAEGDWGGGDTGAGAGGGGDWGGGGDAGGGGDWGGGGGGDWGGGGGGDDGGSW